jgi:putative holliday junction resolvase
VDEPVGVPGRVLGLDLGDARIGVAISDDRRRIAVPLGTVRTGAPADVKAIADLVHGHGVTLVVVGHPIHLSGEAGERAHHAERFAEALDAFLDVPVLLQDERLSSVEADRALREAGASGRERRRAVDRSAATVILQAWLDAAGGG